MCLNQRETEGWPILHTHFEQDEWWYVLEGEFLIKVGGACTKQNPAILCMAPYGSTYFF